MISVVPLELERTLAGLPPPPPTNLREQVQALLRDPASKIPILVALDDDPTGTQTCHDIPVLTVWDTPTLISELRATQPGGGFSILTNSRALHPEPARVLITEICANLRAASAAAGVPFEIVLRSESTLRGHFPLEADVAGEVLSQGEGAAASPVHAWLLCPFFLQGG
jgi:hypothetical protein